MARIAPPDVLVCDGGGGVLKAAKVCFSKLASAL